MNAVKLHFTVETILSRLLNDNDFQIRIAHLTPERTNNLTIKLVDPNEDNSILSSEIVILINNFWRRNNENHLSK